MAWYARRPSGRPFNRFAARAVIPGGLAARAARLPQPPPPLLPGTFRALPARITNRVQHPGRLRPSSSPTFRVDVYGGTDPVAKRRIRFRKTCKDEVTARIELGKFLAQAQAGKQAESAARIGQLLDQYLLVGDWGLATREGYEGYIRRTIRPALGHVQVRKVRGPMLDALYARLRKCGDLACTGRPFTEHRNVPRLLADPVDGRPAWQQVADELRDAIQSGELPRRVCHLLGP